MSGGHFEYPDSQMRSFYDQLAYEIANNKEDDSYGYSPKFGDEVIGRLIWYNSQLKPMIDLARDIDKLYSGDHSQETFIQNFDAITKRN
jgi:hypothetical protein